MTDTNGFICCEESFVVIAYCCTRGAAKGKCILGLLPEIISSVRQECCCDCRCQIPPGDPSKEESFILLASHAATRCFTAKAGVQQLEQTRRRKSLDGSS